MYRKEIVYDRETHDFDATFDGNYIGSFPTKHDAENELNQYVLLLCEQGLLDTPLAALAEQALVAANPVPPTEPTTTLCINTWYGRDEHPVEIIKETTRRYLVKILRDNALVPGGRRLNIGDTVYVPKYAIKHS